jgi:hypothetical protein
MFWRIKNARNPVLAEGALEAASLTLSKAFLVLSSV